MKAFCKKHPELSIWGTKIIFRNGEAKIDPKDEALLRSLDQNGEHGFSFEPEPGDFAPPAHEEEPAAEGPAQEEEPAKGKGKK